LSTCSTYDSHWSSGDRKKRAVYQSELAPDPERYECNDYAANSVDTDVTEIMAYATDTTRFGNRSGSGNQSSNHIPYPEWIELPEEQRNKILLKETKRDWRMLVAIRHLILQLVVLTLITLKHTLIWTA
jgi:hypothetical protein